MRLIRMISAAVLAAGLLPVAAHAEAADAGAVLFGDFCAACHGESGKGDGDMAGVMTIPAPNLTLLSTHNDGVFPMLKVIHTIDGRSGVRSHGGPMPIFGKVFATSTAGPGNPYGDVLVTRGRVLSLALYLESIQQ